MPILRRLENSDISRLDSVHWARVAVFVMLFAEGKKTDRNEKSLISRKNVAGIGGISRFYYWEPRKTTGFRGFDSP